MVQSIDFDATEQSLICISAHGPASDVTWNRNGKNLTIDGNTYSQVQVVNTTESVYVNTLVIRELKPEEVAGNYTCIVRNLRGNAEKATEIRGKDNKITVIINSTT